MDYLDSIAVSIGGRFVRQSRLTWMGSVDRYNNTYLPTLLHLISPNSQMNAGSLPHLTLGTRSPIYTAYLTYPCF